MKSKIILSFVLIVVLPVQYIAELKAELPNPVGSQYQKSEFREQ